jgi:hypothetical protein
MYETDQLESLLNESWKAYIDRDEDVYDSNAKE